MHFPPLYRMFAASSLSLAVSLAHAQSAGSGEVEEVIVTATGLSTATSSTKTGTPIIESPQSISVISREEIDLRAAATIADALSYSASVQPESSGIDSRTDEISVRGFGAGGFSSNNNFVDGLRLPSGGQWTRFGFDPFGLQQLEVLKGPSSVLYGQSAPGGMVNMVTKRPDGNARRELLVQSQGYTSLKNVSNRIAGDISGTLNSAGTVQGRLVGLAHDGGTQVNDVDNSRYYFSPSVNWSPNDELNWTLLAQYQRDEGGATYQFLPATGAYRASNGRYIENDANIGEPDWNEFARDQLLIGSFLTYELTPSLTLRSNARVTQIDTLYRVTVLSGDTIANCAAARIGPECVDGATIGRRAVQGDGESEGYAIDTQLEGRFDTGAFAHTLLGGVDYFHTQWDHFRDGVNLPGLPAGQVDRLWNIFEPQPRGIAGYETNMAPQGYSASTSTQSGFYLQDQIEYGNLRLTAGGRYDSTEDDNLNLLTNRRFVTDAEAFTGRAGAVYLFENGLTPFVSYSESFLPQSVDPASTLDGVLFEPTTGEQVEAGLRYQSGRNIYLTAGVFDITQQNVATPDPNGTICGNRVCQVQTGEAQVKGVEFEGRASLPNGTTLIASASRLDAKVTESNDPIVGNKLAAVPEHLASLFIDHCIGRGALAGLGFGAGARYTGESFGDTNNTFAMDSYTLFDLLLRYDLGVARPNLDGMSLSLNMRNVSDKRYTVICSGVASCYYGQGRVLTARFQYRW